MSDKKRILVVEDDEDINELVVYNLKNSGYEVKGALAGKIGMEAIAMFKPDLVLLDIMLPDMDGLEICRKLKSTPEYSGIKVIMLTAKGEDSDIILGLEIGADDYIPKPFSIGVLKARVRASLRQDTVQSSKKIEYGDLSIDIDKHQVIIDEEPIELTVTEFNLLVLMAARPQHVFSREAIINQVKGQNYYVTERSVDVQIVSLRKKLGNYSRLIKTVRGVGYKFENDESI
ncbi:MAG: response regulator [Myxococcota bacterium]